jgi:hypothetical protein
MIDRYDNAILSTISPLLAEMGLTLDESKAVLKAMTQLECTVNFTMPRECSEANTRRLVWIKAVLCGTVFSGHPTRTTWGNTIRSLLSNYGLAKFYGYLTGYYNA